VSLSYDETLLHPEGRVLSTMEQDGSRRWLTPRLSKGRFWSRRRAVAYALVALFTALPYVRINHKPAILLDLATRHFTLLGYTFLPTDTALLALLLVSFILSIFFVTALLGRVWCGWGCPQTVYMEFLFRPIERLCTGRTGTGGKPRANVPAWRLALMYLLFTLASLFLANTFLSYFVGVEQLRHWVTRSPIHHPASFLIVLATTAAILLDFAFFREQICLIACPYGRLQSVLMDRQSLIISYDPNRGEPRGPMKKRVSLPQAPPSYPKPAPSTGDCIDCEMCVSVCPTGIDIRDGLQFECIGCAQCIDACDAVMTKVNRPLGLIRYSSQAAMAGQPTKILRPRVLIYSLVVIALLSLLSFLLATKPPVDVTLLRGLGRPFLVTDAGQVENPMRVKLTNRTDQPLTLRFSTPAHPSVRVQPTQDSVTLAPGQVWTEPVQLFAPTSLFTFGTADITLRVSDNAGVNIDTPCRLIGPIGSIPDTN
jgi:cytochrome c oxidase accessory protein FixG